MNHVDELFGRAVFNDDVMQNMLPKDTYKALKKTIDEGRRLDPGIAGAVAHAMKEWAIANGVTHYTHWFQPMTGITAEKHDAFLTPMPGGRVIQSFSGSELVRGEADGSSFPSGGLRSTFEARGYTAWDPTSYAFIKDGTLCIPTAFCSYGGEALDKKTPLLRSMEALSKQAVRILRLLGRDARRVLTTVGPEQEYFLVDREMFHRRMDLVFTGRTLFGAKPPKGQELEDHYYGAIKPRVQAFMSDLNDELWKLGILAKTEHNEVAPGQHEMAPIYAVSNVSADHNQLTMETMKKVAERHGLVCLLHEKPFAGVNGSGKHNNWSLSTDTGYNLLEPGDSPYDSAQFLLFLTAVIHAVDEYQELLRVSVASAGNDHRLGANEAPPAIMSIFLGDELTAILQAIESGTAYQGHSPDEMAIGVHVLPKFPRDNTDRNRTSPFAFTGNKFEFRSLGASASISDCNVVLNTIVAEALRLFADELEQAEDFKAALHDLIVREIKAHKRIIFNGNGYAASWAKEAEARGLSNLRDTVDALPTMIADRNVDVFVRHRVFSVSEIRSRYEIYLEAYAKVINIEAETALTMASREILPAVMRYTGEVAAQAAAIKGYSPALNPAPQEKLLTRLTDAASRLSDDLDALHEAVTHADASADALTQARYQRDRVLRAMNRVRADADELETLVERKAWPFPTYSELLFEA
ncbi:MAG: glutamine synthetase III [Clostridia bacterium]|nr:glutamine synthetase III [Clostridia bacterium]MBR6028419.1 glutamine synthetase III [Clostridia bacterium]